MVSLCQTLFVKPLTNRSLYLIQCRVYCYFSGENPLIKFPCSTRPLSHRENCDPTVAPRRWRSMMRHIIRCCEQSFGLSLVVGFGGYTCTVYYPSNNKGIWKLEKGKVSRNTGRKFGLSKNHWCGFHGSIFLRCMIYTQYLQTLKV